MQKGGIDVKWKKQVLSLVMVLLMVVNGMPFAYATEDNTSSNVHDAVIDVDTVVPTITFDLPKGDGASRDDGQIWYRSNKELELIVQDEGSGINNIDVSVNGVDVPEDKNKVAFIKASAREAAGAQDNDELHYLFDLDYFTSLCERAGDKT